ncbi:MAG TPA: hypothetical protein VMT17_15915 [Anaeromyxobacteraceae bacterium]|nr:hypothetical protein [Anaeromyxobacteraceae bacterium]
MRAADELRLFSYLVAAHSVAIGGGLAAAPDFATGLAGFGPVRPVFFARQAGVFHLVLAAGYVLDARRGSAAFLVTAKAIAVVFLAAAALAGVSAWAVPVSGAADGAMALVGLWLWRRAARLRTA